MSRHKDPTQTLTIRERAVSSINRRFRKLKSEIKTTIRDNPNILTTNEKDGRYLFLRSPEKVAEFSAWLKEQIRISILTPSNPSTNWLSIFVRYGYERGVSKTTNKIKTQRVVAGSLPTENIFTHPIHVERSELLFTRVYSQLKGVTETMEQQIASVLTDGILKGTGIKDVAEKLGERVDKIGATRSRLIARTEIVNAHNIGSVEEAKRLEVVIGEKINMQWLTAMDGRERPSHRLRNKKIYEKDKALTLIGEPNCRCSISPIIVE